MTGQRMIHLSFHKKIPEKQGTSFAKSPPAVWIRPFVHQNAASEYWFGMLHQLVTSGESFCLQDRRQSARSFSEFQQIPGN